MTPVHLPVGTYVEVWRTRIVKEICVVECSDPLLLRRASMFERIRAWFKNRPPRKGELGAAYEAADLIRRTKEGIRQ